MLRQSYDKFHIPKSTSMFNQYFYLKISNTLTLTLLAVSQNLKICFSLIESSFYFVVFVSNVHSSVYCIIYYFFVYFCSLLWYCIHSLFFLQCKWIWSALWWIIKNNVDWIQMIRMYIYFSKLNVFFLFILNVSRCY